MKMILVALGILTLPTLALDIPRHVFSLDKLEEAKTKAAEDQEPLVFVYTDPGTT